MDGIISLSKLKDIKIVYYHGSCADGITAREILKYTMGNVDFKPYYFTELRYIPKNALFIDCSPKTFQVEDCLNNGCLIAEHHESFTESYNRLNKMYPETMMIGDTSKGESGALLACAIVEQMGYVIPEKARKIAEIIAISDTWQKENKDFAYGRMIAGYISFFSNDFDMNLETLYESEDTIMKFGAVQQRKQEQLAHGAVRLSSGEMTLAFINELNMSNAAEILRTNDDIDVIVGWIVKYEPKEDKNIIIYSLRSKEDGFDSSAFCKRNGGGGHKAAAGFSREYEIGADPIAVFLNLLNCYKWKLPND